MTSDPVSYALPADHPSVKPPRTGVLIINLGTPDAPDALAVKRYLKEFLSDKRVVEIPSILWQPLLRGFILNTRPRKSAEGYAKVWMDGGSPLAVHTRDAAHAMQARFGDSITVDWAMRYGNPSIASRLTAMREAGIDRILIAPLYPQYCGATTATANDEVFRVLMAMRWQPALRTLPPYHDNPQYINALATSMRTHLAALDFEPEVILTSFHGMPERTLMMGDPYHCQCRKTARLLGEALGRDVQVSFQSRFGRAKWLEPATDRTLQKLAEDGVKSIAVVTPGFSADCLETLEEIAMQGEEIFSEHGGEKFAFLPCLNATDPAILLYDKLLGRELSGWWPDRE